jgi:hypothetical protein
VRQRLDAERLKALAHHDDVLHLVQEPATEKKTEKPFNNLSAMLKI